MPAVTRLTRTARTRLHYAHRAREFRLPPTAHSRELLATVFPIEWKIIADTESNKITF